MKRKKIGASLVIVVTVFGAILVTGTAVSTMTIGDYRLKQMQSNKMHNLYGADSGLDSAYDAIVADFDLAGNYAGFKVKQLKKGVSECTANQDKYNALIVEEQNLEKNNPDKDQDWFESQRKRIQKNIDVVINAEFQRTFKLFLNSDWAECNSGEYAPNKLDDINTSDSKNKIIYVEKINKTSDDISNVKEDDFEYQDIKFTDSPTITITFPEKNLTNDEITVTNEFTDNYKIQQSVKIEITSAFKTKEGESGEKVVGKNESTLKASYNLIIPNYDDIYFTEQEKKSYVYDVYKDKAITVFGNMEVRDMGTSKLTIGENSNVFVLGDKDNLPSTTQTGTGNNVSSDTIIGKYQGGISLESASGGNTTINFKSKVISGGTFNIQKNVDVDIDDDLYALNVYAGRKNGEESDNSSLTVNSMIIDNDLALKATDTHISMDNFYGINDKHVEDNLDDEKTRNSSSIIVNTYNDASSVNISETAYIMGVAYIDTDGGYQTGESVGVKGNYKAYSSEAVKDKDDNLNFSFGQEGTLYLINGKVQSNNTVDPNVTVADKEEHFVNYWNENGNVQTGGVKLPADTGNIHSVGAIVYKAGDETKIAGSNYNLDDTTILEKQRDYAKNVYNLGEDVRDTTNSGKTQEELLSQLYNDRSSTTYSKDDIISDFMTLSEITDDESGKIVENDGNKGVFNKDDTKKVIIRGEGSTYQASDDDIVLDASSGKLSAFIATAGDVIIDGKVEFTGNIIAEENLIVQGSGDKTITYDEKVAQSIQISNPDIFKNVFKLGQSTDSSTSEDGDGLKIDYDLGKFLKNLLWKIMN